ncbi:hypothetical protein [Spiroplasma endosymbiont of Zeiraphera isertana]|uniref:hypothetical protein n=1 Tax=Spiroplasma endosymbiont of Zeiraphera isertana TaxID=3066313 RepID=UPI00313D9D99
MILSNCWFAGVFSDIHKTFNLDKINPSNYNKIELLFDDYIYQTKITWGGYYYGVYEADYYACISGKEKKAWDGNNIWVSNCNNEYKTTVLSALNNKNLFKDVVSNLNIREPNSHLITTSARYLVQRLPLTYWNSASIEGIQYFGLNWFEENYNFYFQFLFHQWATCHASRTGGLMIMYIGKGIRLYNDDENIRTKREIFDINNLEEKNVTKWTDDFSKSINHEQHLTIDNKKKFVTNNITSL